MVALVATLLAPAAAAASAPRLLSNAPGDQSSFDVRPIAMSFYHYKDGGGFDYIGGANSTMRTAFDSKARIRWRRWGARASARIAYYIVGATGYTDRVLGTVRASRVRAGRFTRLAISFSHTTGVYVLARTRLKANGAPHGLLAYEWCQGPLERSHRCFEP
jgi:hypothetical protein